MSFNKNSARKMCVHAKNLLFMNKTANIGNVDRSGQLGCYIFYLLPLINTEPQLDYPITIGFALYARIFTS